MGDAGNYSEERYIGGRLFRRLMDGRVVEVMSDGSVKTDFEVGGGSYSQHSADLDTLSKAVDDQGSSAIIEDKDAPTEDRVREYAAKKAKESASKSAWSSSTFSGVYKGSVKDLFKNVQGGTPIGGSHQMGSGHGLVTQSTGLSGRADPLREMLDKSKAEHVGSKKGKKYSEHVSKVMGSRSGSGFGMREQARLSGSKSRHGVRKAPKSRKR